MTVFVPGLSGESLAFFEALKRAPQKTTGVRFIGIHFPGVNKNNYVDLSVRSTQRAYFMQQHLRSAIDQGRVDLMPLDYIGALNDLMNAKIDVAIAQVSVPDTREAVSLGTTYDFLPAVWQQARIKVAHVNPRMPKTLGSFQINLSDCDLICESESSLVTNVTGISSPELSVIAQSVAEQIHDGDTLQLGIGKLPSNVLSALGGHRNLRIYSGMITDAVLPLIDCGVIAGDASIVTGTTLGSEAFYTRLGEDHTFYFRPVSETHDVRRIAEIPSFVSINSAVEVDLLGQVNSECVDGQLIAGIGGMPAFVHGARLSSNGRAIFCLSSTAAKGKVSRIVPMLGHGSLVSLPRHAVDVLITEHGIAYLRGLPIHARAERIIELAAPSFQQNLSEQWANIRHRL
ncbi:MAG: acetyl-CoA hydrolase/transferase C-terminal domain-containing protein [Georgfuchsia sp.]